MAANKEMMVNTEITANKEILVNKEITPSKELTAKKKITANNEKPVNKKMSVKVDREIMVNGVILEEEDHLHHLYHLRTIGDAVLDNARDNQGFPNWSLQNLLKLSNQNV